MEIRLVILLKDDTVFDSKKTNLPFRFTKKKKLFKQYNMEE